ncbi:hypothetical protein JTE90_023960 [Oedothorax gibbosus]|uniref:dynamin GTPase n=1 Tax=Oedothorax gibbosus TaxID=931172 RepID=A0AAV6US04_9ARAC|nr:hypothetical protein JTE90_023960 [Oedothorax gibbosus]
MFSTPRRNNFLPRRESSFQQDLGARKIHDECDLIEMVNKLQNKLAASGKLLDISLPQIVVVGCQSAGKSSVLESIIGREFLPRGKGTVTRRPTVIQLQPSTEIYGVFLHLKDRKFTDFEAIKQEIIDETMREPGPTGFSSKPINLKIYAPNVLKLSLVDMPGIIKNVIGNQSEEVIEDVKNMIMKYIEQPNSLILAVSPANQDIATSDALEIAKKVDPKRERTLGVLTKLDLMDAGTDAKEVLENKTLPLKRGYVGVLNRSQQDIEEDRNIEYSLAKEKRFFENNPAYSHMADVMGSPYLQKLLHVQLREHIKKTLPTVRKELMQKLNSVRNELREFDAIMNLSTDKSNAVQAYLFKLVQYFIDDFHTKLFGNSERVNFDTLDVGAIINYKLYTDLQKILEMPTSLKEEELITLIANEQGIRNTLSIPSVALEAACGSILDMYIDPLQSFVDSITDLLISGVEQTADLLKSYPYLKSVLVRFINEAIDEATAETKELLNKHIEAEMMYCNIYNYGFKNSKLKDGILCNPVKIWKAFNELINDDEKEEIGKSDVDLSTSVEYISGQLVKNTSAKENSKILSDIVVEYMQLIQKQIGDVTIKYIMCFLVKKVSEFIKTCLLVKLMASDNLKSLLEECERDFRIREEMVATCADLEEALIAVQSF